MNAASISKRGVWILALVTLGVGMPIAGLILSRPAPGSASLLKGDGDSRQGTSLVSSAGKEGVVCFGYVDLEHGVTSLYPLQPGRVVDVPVHEGESVPEGTVLVRLDEGPAQSRVAEAEAALAVAQLQLDKARKLPEQQRSRIAQQKDAVEVAHLRVEAARRLLVRKQKLAQRQLIDTEEPAVTEDQVKELEVLERTEQKRLDELTGQDPTEGERRAEKEVAIAQLKVTQARFALADCTLKAPRPGTALRILVGPGDVLSGQPKQAAILFAIEGPRVIRAEVEQEFIGRVAAGMPARVEDEFDSSQSWTGTVVRVAPWFSQRRSILNEPNQFNDVRTVECLIQLDAKDLPLRIGQRVRVRIGNVKEVLSREQ